jgi:Rieske 2Fe-2S family protein
MSDLEFRPTSTHFRLGATTLPGEYYTSPAVFAAERQRIGLRSWHCVGRSARILQPGDFFLQDLAGESVIVLRIKDGSIRAHFNLCRHRGTRLCDRESGRFSETIQCPYHAWTYGLDGRLVGAPHMNEVPDFRKQDYPLHSARVAEWEGFLFLNLDPDPIPFDRAFGPLLSRLERFSPARLVSARRRTYQVGANWKLVFQNYSECLHCPMIHPELTAKVPYQSGANDLVEGPLLGGFMEIVPGHQSVTLSGRPAGPAISAAAEDRMRGYYYTAIPNWMISIHPDYLNYYTIWPLGPDRTRI